MNKSRQPKHDGSVSKATLDYLVDKAIETELKRAYEEIRKMNKKPVQKKTSLLHWVSEKVKQLYLYILAKFTDLPWPNEIHIDIKISKNTIMVLALAVLVAAILILLYILIYVVSKLF